MSRFLKTKHLENRSLSQNYSPDAVSVKRILEENIIYSKEL